MCGERLELNDRVAVGAETSERRSSSERGRVHGGGQEHVEATLGGSERRRMVRVSGGNHVVFGNSCATQQDVFDREAGGEHVEHVEHGAPVAVGERCEQAFNVGAGRAPQQFSDVIGGQFAVGHQRRHFFEQHHAASNSEVR